MCNHSRSLIGDAGLIVVFGVFVMLGVAMHPQCEALSKKARYKCTSVMFDSGVTVIHDCFIGEDAYRDWFVNDYVVNGERQETPKDAVAVGAVIVTDGKEMTVVPIFSWRVKTIAYFSCQSSLFGDPPRFSVVSSSRKAFLEALVEEQKRLAAL